MYTIYCDNTLIYTDQNNTIKYKLIDANLHLEDNAAGSLELTIPPVNKGYSLIKKMKSHITVYRNGEKIFGGRPISESFDFNMNRQITCEGELAYLNDTYQPGKDWMEHSVVTVREYITAILSVHNNKCNGTRNYNLPAPVNTTGSNYTEYNKYYSTFYNPELKRLTSFVSGSWPNFDMTAGAYSPYEPYNQYATTINEKIIMPTLSSDTDNYMNYRIQVESYLNRYNDSDTIQGNTLRNRKFKYRFIYRLSDNSFKGISDDWIEEDSYTWFLPNKTITTEQRAANVKMEVAVQACLTDAEIERRHQIASLIDTDITDLNSGDNYFTYRVLSNKSTFDDTLYNRQIFEKGAYVDHGLGANYSTSGEYSAYATSKRDTTNVNTAIIIPTLNHVGEDYSKYAVMIKAFPFTYEYDPNTTYNNKLPHFKYRVLYKKSNAASGETYISNWVTDSTFYFRFSNIKLTQAEINSGVTLVCRLEVTKTDNVQMSDLDIENLNTGINYIAVRVLDNTNLDSYGSTSQVSIDHSDKRIYTGAIFFPDDLPKDFEFKPYQSTMEALKTLVDKFKGHVRVRTGSDGKLYLDYLKDYINTNTQSIELGKNLMDYTQEYNLSEFASVLLPLGKKKDDPKVGKEIMVHWNENSAIEPNGCIRYGKYFHITNLISVKQYELEKVWDSYGNYSTQQRPTELWFMGEQINGYPMYAFYDLQMRLLGSGTANDGTYDSQRFTNWEPISIPQDAAYVVFGFYYGGNGGFTSSSNGASSFTSDSSGSSSSSFSSVSEMAYTSTRVYDTVFKFKYDSLNLKYEYTMNDVSRDIHVETGRIINVNTNYFESKLIYGNDYVVSDPIVIPPTTEKEVTYFYTSRMDNGLGIYTVHGGNDSPIVSTKTASSGTVVTDNKKEAITCPIGSRKIYVAGKKNVAYDPHVYYDVSMNSDAYYNPPDEYVTIESVNNGSLYLENVDFVREYGWIEKTMQWDEADTPAKLKALANDYMRTNFYDEMTLNLTAFDLHMLNADIEAIDILDQIRCVSSFHKLDRYFPVTDMQIPLLHPEDTKYTLTLTKTNKSISDNTVSDSIEIYKRLEDVPDPSAVLLQARNNATEIMNLTNNGFVYKDDHEILIMDTPDKATATRMWRMNVNGIGYSSNGYNGPFGLAFTMDGAIVADRITTGYMHADRIRGGTLTLGGYDGTSGEFRMLNEDGLEFIHMDKDGAEFLAKISTTLERSGENRQLQGGIVTFDDGMLTGYTATLQNTSPFTSNPYRQVSFSEISNQSKVTTLNLLGIYQLNNASGVGQWYKGIEIDPGEAFFMHFGNTQSFTGMIFKPDSFEVWRNGSRSNSYSGNIQFIKSITNNGNGTISWVGSTAVVKDGFITMVDGETGDGSGSGGGSSGGGSGGGSDTPTTPSEVINVVRFSDSIKNNLLTGFDKLAYEDNKGDDYYAALKTAFDNNNNNMNTSQFSSNATIQVIGISDAIKNALITIFDKAAWSVENGNEYYTRIQNALNSNNFPATGSQTASRTVGISTEIKTALMNIVDKITFGNGSGESYCTALQTALNTTSVSEGNPGGFVSG